MTSVPQRSYLGTPATAPGPSGPQMLACIRKIRADPLGFLTQMRDEYGDVVQFPIPRPPTYLISSAAGAQQVLVRASGRFDKNTIQYRSLSLVTGAGLLTATNADWRQQRPVVQPAFHRALLPELQRVVLAEVNRTLATWALIGRPAVVDVEAAMMSLTLRIVGRALFGDDLRGDAGALADATIAALEVVIQRSRVPIMVPRTWPTRANRKLTDSLAMLDRAVDRLLAQRADRRLEAAPESRLLIDLLMDSGWSREQVRDQVVTFLVAGHETAASGITWALWLLAGDPGRQDWLADGRVEDDVVPERTAACADEALRLFPPAWVISRDGAEAETIDGCEIPAGALLIVSPFLLQRDPRYWRSPSPSSQSDS